ncbi:trans-sulfuration enzyme family protein [Niallia sp. Marseille-Q9988]
MKQKQWGFDTKLIHGTHPQVLKSKAISNSIIPAVAYAFPNIETATAAVVGDIPNVYYGRYGNPTLRTLEQKIAFLENGEDALGLSSGMAAIATAILAFAKKDDHIIITKDIYGGTYNFLSTIAKRYGIFFDFIDCTDSKYIVKAIKPNTKAIFIETPSNPLLTILDIQEIANVSKQYDLPLIVDNTFMTPYLQKPLDLGATIVVHSATKYINGHGDVLAGFIIGKERIIELMRKNFMGNLGQNLNAFDSYLILRGLKTMAIRMNKHCENALQIANYLKSHPSIQEVYYPGLTTHPQHSLAKKQMKQMGGIISFEVKGNYETAVKFLNSLKLAYISFSLGDPETFVQHPASMTHSSIPEVERAKMGITNTLIRLSAGLENAIDIIHDIDQALLTTSLQSSEIYSGNK